MARNAFLSFHYEPDNWRASQIRQTGAIEGNVPLSDSDWDAVTKGGKDAIETWIDGELSDKSCAIVLGGTGTGGRTWINYEIVKAWTGGKGVVVVHIHGLKDRYGNQSTKGPNPLTYISYRRGVRLSSVAKAYDPPFSDSTAVYNHIAKNIEAWVEEAITIRANN